MGNLAPELGSRGHQPVSGEAGPKKGGPDSRQAGVGRESFSYRLRPCAPWFYRSETETEELVLEAGEEWAERLSCLDGWGLSWLGEFLRPDRSFKSLPGEA